MSNDAFDLWLKQNVEPTNKDGFSDDEKSRFTVLDKKLSNAPAGGYKETSMALGHRLKGVGRIAGSPKSVEVKFTGMLSDEDMSVLGAYLRAWLG